MSVVIEPEILDKIGRLERAGNFSMATLLRGQNEVNLDALLFQSFVPAKYLALLGQHSAFHALQWNGDGRRTRERDDKAHEFASQLQALRQQQIDQNRLSLTVNGHEIDISQGEARKILERRLAELRKRQEELLISGEDPEELARITDLVEAYAPVADRSRKEKIDPEAIQDLIDQDPELAEAFEKRDRNSAMENNRRTSFTAEHFEEKSEYSLRDNFAKQVTPDVSSSPVSPSVPKKNPESTFEAAKF